MNKAYNNIDVAVIFLMIKGNQKYSIIDFSKFHNKRKHIQLFLKFLVTCLVNKYQ